LQRKGVGVLRVILWSSFVFLLLCTLLVVMGAVWAVTVPERAMSEELFSIGVSDRTTRLYYYDNEGEAIELADDRISGFENALYCKLEEMPPHLQNAFIAIEDKRFYEHGGIDWLRTLSAICNYVTGGERSFGGSTITQQLIKNLTGDNEKSVSRKVGELMRAADLERKLSKQDILEQ